MPEGASSNAAGGGAATPASAAAAAAAPAASLPALRSAQKGCLLKALPSGRWEVKRTTGEEVASAQSTLPLAPLDAPAPAPVPTAPSASSSPAAAPAAVDTSRLYFEVRILKLRSEKGLCLGICEREYPASRPPGHDPRSYALWSSGRVHAGSTEGKEYHSASERWKEGDVLGCQLHLSTQELSFTRNGVLLGVASTKLPVSTVAPPKVTEEEQAAGRVQSTEQVGRWHAVVALRSALDSVEVDLQGPFLYQPRRSTLQQLSQPGCLPRQLVEQIRKNEQEGSEQSKLLASLSSAAGHPVSFIWSPLSVYRSLRSSRHRLNLAYAVAHRYLPALCHMLLTPDASASASASGFGAPPVGALADPLSRPLLLRLWTSRCVTFSLVPEDYQADPTSNALWTVEEEARRRDAEQRGERGAAGLRFLNGDLDLFTRVSTFDQNLQQLRRMQLTSRLDRLTPGPDPKHPKKTLSQALHERALTVAPVVAASASAVAAPSDQPPERVHTFSYRFPFAVSKTSDGLYSAAFSRFGRDWKINPNQNHIYLNNLAGHGCRIDCQFLLEQKDPSKNVWQSVSFTYPASTNFQTICNRPADTDACVQDDWVTIHVWMHDTSLPASDKAPLEIDPVTKRPNGRLLKEPPPGAVAEVKLKLDSPPSLPLVVRTELAQLASAEKDTLLKLNTLLEPPPPAGASAAAPSSPAASSTPLATLKWDPLACLLLLAPLEDAKQAEQEEKQLTHALGLAAPAQPAAAGGATSAASSSSPSSAPSAAAPPKKRRPLRSALTPAQGSLVSLVLQRYLPALVDLLLRESSAHAEARETLLKHWTSRKITFTLREEKHATSAAPAPAAAASPPPALGDTYVSEAHVHPLTFTSFTPQSGHSCDLCRGRMVEPAWRCQQCDFDAHAQCRDGVKCSVWRGDLGLRLMSAGDLDLFTTPGHLGLGLDALGAPAAVSPGSAALPGSDLLAALLDACPGETLPLSLRLALRQQTEARELLLSRTQRRLGLAQPLRWDAERDAEKIYAQMRAQRAQQRDLPVSQSAAPLLDLRLLLSYVSSLCALLSSACRSSPLLKDAVASDLLRSGCLSVRLVPCVASELGRKAIVREAQLAIVEGEKQLSVVSTLEHWGRDVSRLQEIDLQAMLDDQQEEA